MSSTLQEDLERYLKREGLYDVIAEHSRTRLFSLSLPIVFMWLVGLWGPAAYFLLSHKGLRGLTVAFVGPPVMFAGAFIVVAFRFALRRLRSGIKLTDADKGTIGGFFLLVFPLLMSVALGVYLTSWLAAITYIAIYAVVMVVALLLQKQAYRVHLLIELVRSVLRALWRSAGLLPVLIPYLFVIVGLSVFSQELWQAIGTLSLPRLVGTALCLLVPELILVGASLNREAAAIVGAFPERGHIVKIAENTQYVGARLREGLISKEEWNRLAGQLEWRSATRLAEQLLPMLRRRTKRWLALLLGCTSLALTASFFAYFCVFLSVVLGPSLVEKWTGIQARPLTLAMHLLGYRWRLGLTTGSLCIAKVSAVLAIFAGVVSTVHALTDEPLKRVYTEWLNDKASAWLAISSLYLSGVSPNYQLWEYVVRDKDKGIANVSIVVPRELPEEQVEEACAHMESCLEEYRTLVTITAFEQKSERPVYKPGMPGNRWRLLHNKVKDIRVFESIPLVLDELRYQHFLGRDSLDQEIGIADEWFGSTAQGIALAKLIWNADADHEWVLHPYVFRSDKLLSLEISLTKRKETSEQYRQCVRQVLAQTKEMVPDAKNIWIDLCFRDTIDTLASLQWSEELPYVSYRDEVIGESKIEEPSAWD